MPAGHVRCGLTNDQAASYRPGKESEFTIDLADEVSGLIGAHPMAPKLKRFVNNESLSVESMRTEGPEHLNL